MSGRTPLVIVVVVGQTVVIENDQFSGVHLRQSPLVFPALANGLFFELFRYSTHLDALHGHALFQATTESARFASISRFSTDHAFITEETPLRNTLGDTSLEEALQTSHLEIIERSEQDELTLQPSQVITP